MESKKKSFDEMKRQAPGCTNLIPALVVLPSGKSGCGLYLTVFLAASLVSSYLLPRALVGLGFVIAFPVVLFVISLIQGFSKWKEWRVVRHSINSSTLTDGKSVAVYGRMYPLGDDAFYSPLGNNKCIAYAYEIYKGRDGGVDDSSGSTLQFEGIGLTPSFVEAKQGRIRLLAWPDFTSHAAGFLTSDNINTANGAEYIRNTVFVEMKPQMWRKGGGESIPTEDGSVRMDAEMRNASKDQMYRYLLQQAKTHANPENVKVLEAYVPFGAEVCLIGTYSAKKQAIVASQGTTNKRVKLYEGDPETVERYFKPFFYAVAVLAGIVALTIGLIVYFAKSDLF